MTTNLFIRIGTYEKYNESMLFFSERGYKWASGNELKIVEEKDKGNVDFDKWLIYKSESMLKINILKKTISLTKLSLMQKYKMEGEWVMNLSTFDKKYNQLIKNKL